MKLKTAFSSLLIAVATVAASAQEKIIILNEGLWQSDNGRLSYFEDGTIVSNKWFSDINGMKIGDTPQDIIQINDNLIAISVNWSNIVQFIDCSGRAVAATEDVPNVRYLCTDGNYVYASSYGHECTTTSGTRTFTKGFVAKIDVNTYQVVDAVEVGYEPEGIALYGGCLFVANSGGYSFSEGHDYEHTVSVVNAETMTVLRTVDVEQINLYGVMSRSGQYLCINSPGDYYSMDAATIIFDCQAALDGKDDADCYVRIDRPSTYNTTALDGTFIAVGSSFSMTTYENILNVYTIDPATVMESAGEHGIEENLPGTVMADIESMTAPYGIYVNPYTGYIYGTDAGSYASAGYFYQWSPEGKKLGKHKVYINPGHFLALPPDGQHFSAVTDIIDDSADADAPVRLFKLNGMEVNADDAAPGLYIRRQGTKATKVLIR